MKKDCGLNRMSETDPLDLKIIKALENDGRVSFMDLARKLKMNESTIRKRVLALQRKGIIRRFTIELDPEKIGLKTRAMVGVDVEPTELLNAVQKLCEIPEIRSVATSTGDHMIMTEIWTSNGRSLTEILVKKVGTIKGIRRICPAIILENFKKT